MPLQTDKIFYEDTIVADATGVVGEAFPYQCPGALITEFENTGANPVTSAVLQMRSHPAADWFDFATDAELETTGAGFYFKNPSGSSVHTLAAGATMNYGIQLLGGEQLRWKLFSTLGTTVVLKGHFQSSRDNVR